jgi:response regulator RpfG family c-di-GMP phosphodiesterase
MPNRSTADITSVRETTTNTNPWAEPVGCPEQPREATSLRVTVLVIDDDIAFRTLVRAFLKGTSYRVIEASDGVKGLAILSCQPVDILITDIVMPEQEGLSTIHQAHRAFPELKILAVSGVQASDNYLRIARVFGAHASLEKPITRESLLELLSHLAGE